MTCTTETFVAHVAGHAGVPRDQAERATRYVVGGIGAYLTSTQREYLSLELPPAIASALNAGDFTVPLDELVLEQGMTAGQAHELVASVCRVLAEELSTSSLRSLRLSLPSSLVRMLEPGIVGAEPPRVHEARRHRKLSSGRPGSEHPISAWHPPAVQPGSVADPNPHADSKLSSTTGSTHERLHQTLAEGQPEPDRTLAGTRR